MREKIGGVAKKENEKRKRKGSLTLNQKSVCRTYFLGREGADSNNIKKGRLQTLYVISRAT
jgi:hypothetical protein